MGNAEVTPEEFVRTWNSAKTLSEVVRKLGLSSSRYATLRACRYRKIGVNLQRFDNNRKLNPAELNRITRKKS